MARILAAVAFTANTLRTKILSGAANTAARRLSLSAATEQFITRGAALDWSVYFDDDGSPLSLSGFDSVTLTIADNASSDATALAQSTVAAAAFTASTLSQWNAGTNQHAVFAFTGDELELSTNGQESRLLYWHVSADVSGETVRLGEGYIRFHGNGDSGPPAPVDNYYTKTEADAHRTLSAAGIMGRSSAGLAMRVAVASQFSLAGDTLSLAYPPGNIPTAGLVDGAAIYNLLVRQQLLISTGDTTDRLAEINAAIEALYAAGGGVLQLGPGLFRVNPTAGGLCILLRTGVRIQGVPGTIIEAGTGAVPFELIAPWGYNTATAVLGAHELDLCDLTLRSSNLADSNCHGLLGLVHCPKARVRRVTFGDVYHHAIELNKCRDVLVEDCDFIGQSHSSLIQFDDGGNAGQMSANVTAASWHRIEATFRRCNIAARLLSATALSANPRQIELSHSTTVELERVIFEDCELGPCLGTAAITAYTVSFSAVPAAVRHLEFRRCRVLGDCVGMTYGLMLGTAGGQVDKLIVDNCFFGAGYDCAGYWCAGGFAYALAPSAPRSYASVSGASGYNTNWQKCRGVRIVGNTFEGQFAQGTCTASFTASSVMLSLAAIDDAIVEGNVFLSPSASTTTTVNVGAGVHAFVTAESLRSLSFRGNKMHMRGQPAVSGLPAAGANVGMAWTQVAMAAGSVDCYWTLWGNTVSADYAAGNVVAYTIREFGTYTPRGGRDTGNIILTNAAVTTRWTSSSGWVAT